jgi:DNA-binding MarR family transcriptional regulator
MAERVREGDLQSDGQGPITPSSSEVEGLHQGLSALLMKAYFYTRRVFDEAMRPHGVSGSQAGVLDRIYTRPGISGIEISREMFTTPQAVQIMLATLERKGLIERRQDPENRRFVQAFLTERGDTVIRACRAEALAAEQRISKGISAEERDLVVRFLEHFLSHANPDR